MARNPGDRSLIAVLLASAALFVVAQLFGSYVFDNGWSFNHWRHIPVSYSVVWLLVACGLTAVLIRYQNRVASLLTSTRGAIIGAAGLFGLLLIFQFDSFLYGGGNLRVAQIAQTDDVIFRWFEYGSTVTVWFFFRVIASFGVHANTAGVVAWKGFAFLCTALSIVGTIKLAGALASDRLQRLTFFAVVFFGPHFLIQFGFVGIEPVVVTVTIWFAYTAARLFDETSVVRYLALWSVVVVGLFFHATLAFIIPVAIYVSLTAAKGRHNIVTLSLPLLLMAGMVVGLYAWADDNLELTHRLLFLEGKPPMSDYGLFAGRRLGDMAQLILLLFPLALFLKYLMVRSFVRTFTQPITVTIMYLCLGGIIVVWVTDPSHSIVLDLPMMAAYLAPGGLLLAVLLRDRFNDDSHPVSPKLSALVITLAVMLPLSYLPAYTRIINAEGFVEDYLDRHDSYWIEGTPALRDAYFYRKDLDKANEWDQKHLVKAPDYLDYQGAAELVKGNMSADAIRSLNNLIARNPYWVAPRALYATIQMEMQRYELAKPQIDTALMLEPYGKEHHVNLYGYYRDQQNFGQALVLAEKTAALFPSDREIRTDVMIINYRAGNLPRAEQMADELMAADPSLPYPYLIKGFILERSDQFKRAVTLYDKFIEIAPDETDTPAIIAQRDRLGQQLDSLSNTQ